RLADRHLGALHRHLRGGPGSLDRVRTLMNKRACGAARWTALMVSLSKKAYAGVISPCFTSGGLRELCRPRVRAAIRLTIPEMDLLAGRKCDVRMFAHAFEQPCRSALLRTDAQEVKHGIRFRFCSRPRRATLP